MAVKAKASPRPRKTAVKSKSAPVRLIVRRGADKRFEKLKEKTAAMDVVVSWDRREGDRRTTPQHTSGERRRQDRRQAAPFTWDTADFTVVIDSQSKE